MTDGMTDGRTTGAAAVRARAVTRRKILHVLEATSAGAARYVADLLLRIDITAFDVAFAYSPRRADDRFWRDLDAIQARGIRIFEIPMARSIHPLDDGKALWRIYRLVKEHGFEVVHGHSSKAGFLARLAAKLAGQRVLTVYSPHAIAISANPAYGHLERFAARFTDVVLGVSRSEREELEGYKLVPSFKLHHVTAGIDIPAFAGHPDSGEFRRQMGIPEQAVLIGAAGRLAPQKDPLTFVRAAAQLHRDGVPAYFAWAGDGELLGQAETLARSLGVGTHMRFPGYCPDLRPFLAALDIFSLTSRYESFGYVTCEAMAMGKPVVATNVAGSNELVQHGKTGFLLPPGDVAACAVAFSRLASNPALRRAMGQAAQRRVREHYDVGRMVRQVEELYRNLLEESWQQQRQLIPA
jgi:glycosyltransferase involved in cell wall biosynthesis